MMEPPSVLISNGYSVGMYESNFRDPLIGEYIFHEEFHYVIEDVMVRRKGDEVGREVRVGPVGESLEDGLIKWDTERLDQEGYIPRKGEHLQLGEYEQGYTYFEVVDVVWRKVTVPGTLPDTVGLGIEPEVYLRQIERDEWAEQISEELRQMGADRWPP